MPKMLKDSEKRLPFFRQRLPTTVSGRPLGVVF
ncbi:uncharacterized protein PGTG_18826 [Puccinia graminis f. sp. tritici CRL 75-36-700-3]|uniref:Uncharacterized protein n=1 Tax=Puccinia graminis f. sp. tritici (strain CRL 75-36-700-3 / race SCCL) TaxID=418459 RepID=E3L7X3_PUCGT|nr:uncharacterized protein PGTG_18826 [Puccinia graminis f. sp. tritici CRL 75-36-700-3]EFP92648.1 hypothetical protein PGTG_18826 [Puccinia graminis f. sp. tritici CRL 75-36-700-3]